MSEMPEVRIDLLQTGPVPPYVQEQIDEQFTTHRLHEASDREAFFDQVSDRVRALVNFNSVPIDAALMARLPRLEIVANMGMGYDEVDAKWAGEHGIVVTNTPDVVTEETADTTIGLLLNTVRELSSAERYLRRGGWLQKPYPLTAASLRDRTCGIIGMGRIGRAIARRIEAFGLPIVYHTRRVVTDVSYRHYLDLVSMARDVDILIAIVPGGPATEKLIDREVLEALGPNGILINVARGSVVDEQALIEALQNGTIFSAGLDVFEDEPHVPQELIEMERVCLLPHVGTASVHTRRAMGQLVVDNLVAWAEGRGPLTPVAETSWPPKPTH
jgi:lactate dehydrogenase-like 2-hydroxyacid dehydrogenase